ncbi:hypothetical protein FE296_15690 [Paenibacillus sp. UASWS1643]|nr:hypothetical protein FE296_15690 [Paenibacillus sp. UASWS1643]
MCKEVISISSLNATIVCSLKRSISCAIKHCSTSIIVLLIIPAETRHHLQKI